MDDMGIAKTGLYDEWWSLASLLATITVLSFETFTEVWKALNSVWYCDFDFGDGPPWWLVYESLSVIGGLICFCAVAYILGVAIFDGIMFIIRKKYR